MRFENLHRHCLPIAVMIVAALYGCGSSGEVLSSGFSGGGRVTETESVTRTVDAAAAARLVAQTVNGRISLRATDGDEVTVEAVKKVEAPNRSLAEDFLQDIEVTVERRNDQVVAFATHPNPPRNVGVTVRFDIIAPADLAAELSSVNGAIHVADMEREVVARTTNGLVDVKGACGPIEARTANGQISADVAELRGEGRFATVNGSLDVTVRDGEMPITASAVNGAVAVAIPGGFSGRLDARTATGRANSDFPVTASVTQRKNRIVGAIGAGGRPVITLRSTNGDVWLRKAD
ncbi:MAG: hypothetical protein QGI83_02080 [Candidatus Latescibacteria bacterium]|jgi:hypothetical protein|nr:hypothetical protein [Candidatus Latescibacterota bacterium]